MKKTMMLAAVIAVAALITTGYSDSGTKDRTQTSATASCTNNFSSDLLLACPGDCTNKLSADLATCPKDCTNTVNHVLATCSKDCTNKLSLSFAVGTLNCTNHVTSVKI